MTAPGPAVNPNWVRPDRAVSAARHRAIVTAVVAASAPKVPAGDPLAGLRPSVAAVARIVGRGHANADAARMLGLSPRTVQCHLIEAYRDLGIGGDHGAKMRRLAYVVGVVDGRGDDVVTRERSRS